MQLHLEFGRKIAHFTSGGLKLILKTLCSLNSMGLFLSPNHYRLSKGFKDLQVVRLRRENGFYSIIDKPVYKRPTEW